jgi:hypothetical protein
MLELRARNDGDITLWSPTRMQARGSFTCLIVQTPNTLTLIVEPHVTTAAWAWHARRHTRRMGQFKNCMETDFSKLVADLLQQLIYL